MAISTASWYSGARPLVWNNLTDSVVNCDIFCGFKRKLKTYLFTAQPQTDNRTDSASESMELWRYVNRSIVLYCIVWNLYIYPYTAEDVWKKGPDSFLLSPLLATKPQPSNDSDGYIACQLEAKLTKLDLCMKKWGHTIDPDRKSGISWLPDPCFRSVDSFNICFILGK